MHKATHLVIPFIVSIALIPCLYTEALRLSPRVIGGFPIFNRCKAPYTSIVALQLPAQFSPITFCSAVMITDTYLLTTAKCLLTMAEMQAQNRIPTAVVGERDLIMKGESGEQRIGIASFKVHRYFNITSGADNIGLIQLARPAKLSSCVKPVARMETDPNACLDVDESCQIGGWGSYTESPTPTNSKILRFAPVTVYSDVLTTLLSSTSQEVPSIGSLYAENRNSYQKACFFDWGGVVSCKRNGNEVLRGIVSDHNCNSKVPYPILILDIPFYQPWIDRCVANWNSCQSV